MTARLLAVALLAVALAAGCESSRAGAPAAPVAAASSVVELRLDRVVAHGPLELELLEVGDSRCPKGVTCVWEGEAKVKFEVAAAGYEPVVLELVLRGGSEADASEAAGHRFVLLAVDPYPVEGVTLDRSERVARIRVSPG